MNLCSLRCYSWVLSIVITTLILTVLQLGNSGAQYPNLENLKSDKIYLDIKAFGLAMDGKAIRSRAKAILRQYGIEIIQDGAQPDDHGPWLVLSTDLLDLGNEGVFPGLAKTCPGKLLYLRKLELWEDVTVGRMANRPIRAVTWVRYFPLPVIVEKVSEEQLLADAERLIQEFALDYRDGNR